MSIRLQLLIVALTTLVLPWAGCQYARELETALRSSQEQSLLAGAGFALLGAALSMMRLSSAGARGAERVRVREDQRLKGE